MHLRFIKHRRDNMTRSSEMAAFTNLTFVILFLCCCNVLASGDHYVEKFKILPETLSQSNVFTINVHFTESLHECQTRFLSVTIDTYSIKTRWKEYNFGSKKLQNLAAALSPCDIRLGGTFSDFLTFDPNGTNSTEDEQNGEFSKSGYQFDSGLFDPEVVFENFTMSGAHWDNVTTFLAKVGWDLMFDFNLFKWKNGLWDPTNAELLLNYSSQRGVKIPYFQLGNEPNSYLHNFNFTISPETLAADFRILKNVISKYPLYNTSGLYGPDVTNLNVPHGSVDYLTRFISAGAYNTVAGITLHHYYLNSRTAVEGDFLNISTLDSLKSELQLAVNIEKTSPRPLSIQLTETSSCFGGGTPNLSNAYIAGFLWLDKLGLSAQYGLRRIFRQSFLGATYGLLSDKMDPNPDYYLSVLFKRLIEGPVFNISIHPQDQHLRVYAHCARKNIYQAGALVIYYLNLRSTQAVLSLPQFHNANLDLYLLTPGDDAGLRSRYVKLNGNLLQMSHATLPRLRPKRHKGGVTVDALSFGFIVVPNSNITLCVKYFANNQQ